MEKCDDRKFDKVCIWAKCSVIRLLQNWIQLFLSQNVDVKAPTRFSPLVKRHEIRGQSYHDTPVET